MKVKTIELSEKTASSELKVILEENFGKKTLSSDVKDQISNFTDILNIVSELRGCRLKEYLPWDNPITKNQKSQNALAKIQLITEAYNQDEELDWTDRNQPKYALYFERKTHGGGWVLRSVHVCGYFAFLGAGSYFKREADARDAYKKFPEIWADFLPE